MYARLLLTVVALMLAGAPAASQKPSRLNPVTELLEQKKPVFGLYAPANPRAGASGATPVAATPKTPAQLAHEALACDASDFVFDGSMESDFERGYAGFAEFVRAMADGGALQTSPFRRLHHPLIVKMHRIAPDSAAAAQHIAQQLNLGVSGIVFVGVESAEEVRAGLAAMRFRSKGGTRPDEVGDAPAYWGMSEREYRDRADVWPLNIAGELINWTIVESREGLAHIREIAAVPGIGVLWPGAGTLRRVFTTTDASGRRVFDEQGWEDAIQKVLAACKEFNVACGYPANERDIELRMRQGFSVFVMSWGEPGFRALELGRKAAGRAR